jgi:hypothetical protein
LQHDRASAERERSGDALPVTVAVNVTDVPVATGLSDDATEVVVLALLTVCPGLSEPVLAPKEPSVLV